MTKKIYGKYEIKEELGALFFNNVLLCREDTKMYQVIYRQGIVAILSDYLS